ncbi:MAG: YezD family protein [Dehalococcoidia bacterium]
MMVAETSSAAPPTMEEQRVLREVLTAIRAISHGTVTLIVQDRRVVQIDRTEKRRLAN